MTVLMVVGIVIVSVLAYLFCGLLGIRVTDKNSSRPYGLGQYDRDFVVTFSLLLGPVWLALALIYRLSSKTLGNSWYYDFTHPKELQESRREKVRDQLLEESKKYRELQLEAWNDQRFDEAELFRTVADDYHKKALV